MNTQEEVLTFLSKNKTMLHQKYHVKDIALFGSFARNEQKENSDVDLLIELEDGTQNVHDIKNALRTFLSQAFERSVDLARAKYLKPYAKEQILKDALFV
jgi:predicted nucleotidyltransferase